MRRRRGVTLIELLVSMAVLVLLVVGASRAFSAVYAYHLQTAPARAARQAAETFERDLAAWLARAYLGEEAAAGAATGVGAERYFVAFDSGTGTGDAAGFPDTLAFTAVGRPVDGAYLESVEEDFATRNARYGPQGGVVEVGIATTPVGDDAPPADPEAASGLYRREQRPPDAEPFQGGIERVWRADVSGIGFEFWNGTTWIAEWDTTTQTEPRLPGAVRVTYTLAGEAASRVFVVRIPLSDVTAEDPAATGGEL